MLQVLLEGGGLSAGELARRSGISASTASSHLGKLVSVGLIQVKVRGRQRIFDLAGPPVVRLLEALALVAPPAPMMVETQVDMARALKSARTCYDHLAGVLGVAITEALVSRRALLPRGKQFLLSSRGAELFGSMGVPTAPLRNQRRPLALKCLDWSERRFHFAGSLGTALTRHMFDAGWLVRVRESRAVRLTDKGRSELHRTLGVNLENASGQCARADGLGRLL